MNLANLTRNPRTASLGSGTMAITDPKIVRVGRDRRVARCLLGKLLKNFHFRMLEIPVINIASSKHLLTGHFTDGPLLLTNY